MVSRSESIELSRSLKDYLDKDIDYDKMCLLCGTEISDTIELKCCKRQFDYDCLVKYLQYEANYPNGSCPYCRQLLKSLPLKEGSKPLKYVHDEFYSKNHINRCTGKKKDGSNCPFKTFNGTNYCKKHQQQEKQEKQQQHICVGIYLSGKLKGTSCQHITTKNSQYCKYHNPKLPSV